MENHQPPVPQPRPNPGSEPKAAGVSTGLLHADHLGHLGDAPSETGTGDRREDTHAGGGRNGGTEPAEQQQDELHTAGVPSRALPTLGPLTHLLRPTTRPEQPNTPGSQTSTVPGSRHPRPSLKAEHTRVAQSPGPTGQPLREVRPPSLLCVVLVRDPLCVCAPVNVSPTP